MLFAETSNAIDGNVFLQVTLIVALASSIAANIVQLLTGRRPQDRNVTVKDGIVSSAEVKRVENDLNSKISIVAADLGTLEAKVDRGFENVTDEMRATETRITDKGEERAVKIHDRVNLVLESVSRMEGRFLGSSPDRARRTEGK